MPTSYAVTHIQCQEYYRLNDFMRSRYLFVLLIVKQKFHLTLMSRIKLMSEWLDSQFLR